MLLPKKTKYRKVRIGKNRGNATRGNYIAFGDYALQSQGNERITSRQIESARQAMTRYIKRGGKIWIRIFPHTPVTRKPVGLRWVWAREIQNSSWLRSRPAPFCLK